MRTPPGTKLRNAMEKEKPLQIVGTINAYVAMMAQRTGFQALYLSGAGVSNSSYGLPDLGLTSLENVLEDTQRITAAVDLPLLVDIDTGWGNSVMIARAVKLIERAGAAAIHIEDQDTQKRCGHLQGKQVVSTKKMTERIKAAVDARQDQSFVIVARIDAFAEEGLEKTIERAIAYRDAGADVIFPEALHDLKQYSAIRLAIDIPILANLTEFGQTPLYTVAELAKANVDIALYPLTVNRCMNYAAQEMLKELRSKGTQKSMLDKMQTREELYNMLNYAVYEDAKMKK